MAESYPPDRDGSSPSPPPLPQPPPQRWQFSLATIMLFTLACAAAASIARLFRAGPWVQFWSLALAIVFLLYLFWRLRMAIAQWGRWNELQRHRQELVEWADRKRTGRKDDEAARPDPSAEKHV
ncbi:MAG TPA: hypothetical protein VFB96_18650 [Pirellulaceae bacterium]|nr:hypothetical protein [Pirellulaceae bacterium]